MGFKEVEANERWVLGLRGLGIRDWGLGDECGGVFGEERSEVQLWVWIVTGGCVYSSIHCQTCFRDLFFFFAPEVVGFCWIDEMEVGLLWVITTRIIYSKGKHVALIFFNNPFSFYLVKIEGIVVGYINFFLNIDNWGWEDLQW